MTAADDAPRWHAAIGWAMVGEEVALPEPGRPDPPALVADLAAVGWPPDRIREHAAEVLGEELPWPHRIPAVLRRGCGAAQLVAAVGRTRGLLGLVTLETRGPSGRTRLDADEQRLLRDVPPHHGG